MKFTCDRKNLQETLQKVARIVSGRSPLPILSNVLIEASGSTITLAATDLELAIQCSLGASVAEEGRLTVPARLLSDLVAQLPPGDVTLAADDRNVAVVTCEQSQYRLL